MHTHAHTTPPLFALVLACSRAHAHTHLPFPFPATSPSLPPSLPASLSLPCSLSQPLPLSPSLSASVEELRRVVAQRDAHLHALRVLTPPFYPPPTPSSLWAYRPPRCLRYGPTLLLRCLRYGPLRTGGIWWYGVLSRGAGVPGGAVRAGQAHRAAAERGLSLSLSHSVHRAHPCAHACTPLCNPCEHHARGWGVSEEGEGGGKERERK
eukprot:821344-Rhodomonas_salina.1